MAAAVGLYVPFGHGSQEDSMPCPCNELYLPGMHGAQVMAETTILVYVLHFPADSCETLDHLPVAHLEHSVAPGPLYFPVGHDLHSATSVAPYVDIYLPPGHA